MRLLLAILLSLPLLADQTVHVITDASPAPIQITGAADQGTDYIRITVPSTTGISAGDWLSIHGVRGCWRVNGTRYVASVVSGTQLDLLARNGSTILRCGGTFTAATGDNGNDGSRQYWARKTGTATLKAPPNIEGMDGLAGSYMTGLASQAVAGNNAWVQTQTAANSPVTSWSTTGYSGSVLSCAIAWHVEGRPASSSYKTCALNLLDLAYRIYHTTGCSEDVASCGRSGGTNAIDQISPDLHAITLAKSIMHSEMSAGQKTQFANTMLNDVGLNNSSETSCTNPYTTGGGTATYVKDTNYLTVTPAAEVAAVEVGDLIAWRKSTLVADSGSGIYATAVDSMTGVITLSTSLSSVDYADTGMPWYYVEDPDVYSATRCGHVWFQKHYKYNTTAATSGVSGGDPYPTAGGDTTSDQSNLTWWRLHFYLTIGAVTCEDDVRGCELFEHAQAYYMTRMAFFGRNYWAGITSAGSGSYRGRVEGPAAGIAATLKNALDPAIDLTDKPFLREAAYFTIYQLLPTSGQGSILHQWGETSQGYLSLTQRENDAQTFMALRGSTAANYLRYWLTNAYGGWTTTSLSTQKARFGSKFFLAVPWTSSGTDHKTLPTQRVFGYPTELDQDIFGNAMQEAGIIGAISKTGWTTSATSIGIWPLGPYLDHAYFGHVGNFQIYRGTGAGGGGWLYMDIRANKSIPTCAGVGDSCGGASPPNTSNVEIGSPSSSTAVEYSYMDTAKMPNPFSWTSTTNGAMVRNVRWAGDDYSGRSASDYMFLSFDAQPTLIQTSSAAGVVNYSIYNYVHSKKGGRDYFLVYVDTSNVSSKRHRYHMHYPNNAQTGEGNTTSDARLIHTLTDTTSNASMHSKILLPASPDMTDFHIIRTSRSELTFNPSATVSYPAKVYSGADTCSFTAPATATLTQGTSSGIAYIWVKISDCTIHLGHNSSGLSASGITLDGGVTAFPGSDYYPIARWNMLTTLESGTPEGWEDAGSYYTPMYHSFNAYHGGRRFVVELGTGTSSEVLVFHEPHGNQTDSATTTTNTQTADWNTVQVDHATLPAVVAFARGGETKETWSFTSTHAGTAQYILTGLAPGAYEAQRGSDTPIEFTVTAGDESATFDGTAGVWAVARTGVGPTIATTSLPDGDEGVAYNQTLAGVCGASPCSWSVASGALPTGLSLNSSTGEISGTTTVAGVFNFTARYTDNSALYNDQPLSITINAESSSVPLAFTFAGATCTAGSSCSSAPVASGGTAPYTYSAAGLPPGVTFSSAGAWGGSPTALGDYEVTITATDSAAASVESTATVQAVVSPLAADFTLKRAVASASSALIEISQSGFDANATIYGVLRGPLGNEVARIEFPPGPASRTGVVEGLSGGTTYQLHILGASSALYSSVTTAANSTSSNSVVYQVSSASVTGTTHLRVRYGGTSALGSTSSIAACSGGVCSVTLTRDSGPLWIADDRCSDGACGTVLASHPARPFMVE